MELDIRIGELVVQRDLEPSELQSQLAAAIRPHLGKYENGLELNNLLCQSVANTLGMTLQGLAYGNRHRHLDQLANMSHEW
jgi:hypothetical protein